MDLSVGAVVLGLGWCAGWFLLWRLPGVPGAAGPRPEGTVPELTVPELTVPELTVPELTVVVPARDEEPTLPTLLAGLAAQSCPAREVIVVDDGSTDGTAAAADAAGARVIRSAPAPDGWLGKPWALRQGIDAAGTDVVVLLDADVEPSPALLARLGATFEERGGLVSVQPYHRVRRWWEHFSAFFNVVAVMGAGIGSVLPPRRQRMAFGPCVIARRGELLAHLDDPSVRASVLEDVALARRFAAAGEPVAAFGGRELVAFRMYDDPHDFVDGWTKNFATGASSTPVMRLLLVVLWITGVLLAGLLLVPEAIWLAWLVYGAFAIQAGLMARQVGSFSVVVALAFGAFALVFVAVFVWSLAKTARGEVRWKGRTIRLRGG
jgi:4,4'-diaponeurosporenoate glycosyltransferase